MALLSNDLILYLPDVMRLFLAVWLFVVGGCVGSFLNVVVLRMPAGIGIARSGSRCPVCRHPIRWFDNIPMISWVVLRGRCRDCGTRISPRYLLVEFTVAAMFLALALAGGLGAASNVPAAADSGAVLRQNSMESWTIYAFHLLLGVTLLGAALIAGDRHWVPRRLFLPALLVGLLAPLALPALHPIPMMAGQAAPLALHGWQQGLADTSWGLFAGMLMGVAAWPAVCRQARRPGAGTPALIASTLVGAYLGWQAVGPVVVLTALTFLIGSTIARWETSRRRGPWLAYLLGAFFLYVLFWDHWVVWWPALGNAASGVHLWGSALVVLLLSLTTVCVTPSAEYETQNPWKESSMCAEDRERQLQAILTSPSYLPVEYDAEFLQQWETRPVRVQLELLKPEIEFARQGVKSTIVVFGGTQIVEAEEAQRRLRALQEALAEKPDDPETKRAVARLERIVAKSEYYDAAREFSRLVSSQCQIQGKCDYVVVTGGGPGIMEAANRGAFDVGAKSVGLNINLPAEQVPNPFITPNLCFQFRYFALRKMHFLMRAKAMVVFPGGFGTLDELFDALTLRQTNRMQEIPVILFGTQFWKQVINFQFLADEGVIADRDLELFSYVDTPAEAWDIIARFHGSPQEIML